MERLLKDIVFIHTLHSSHWLWMKHSFSLGKCFLVVFVVRVENSVACRFVVFLCCDVAQHFNGLFLMLDERRTMKKKIYSKLKTWAFASSFLVKSWNLKVKLLLNVARSSACCPENFHHRFSIDVIDVSQSDSGAKRKTAMSV